MAVWPRLQLQEAHKLPHVCKHITWPKVARRSTSWEGAWTHNSAECPMCYKRPYKATTTEGMCGELHHHSLHTAGLTQGGTNTRVSHSRDRDKVQKKAADIGQDHNQVRGSKQSKWFRLRFRTQLAQDQAPVKFLAALAVLGAWVGPNPGFGD